MLNLKWVLIAIATIITVNVCLAQSALTKVVATKAGIANSPIITFDMTDAANFYDTAHTTARSGYLETSAFARGRFTTSAATLEVTGVSNLYGISGGALNSLADLGVRVNGSDFQALNFTSTSPTTFTINLGAGDKVVEIVNGATTSGGTANIYGSWATSVTFSGDERTAKSDPIQSKRMVIYGDSISVGDNSTNPSLQAWPLLVRDAWDGTGSIVVEGYGYRSLNDDCTSQITCESLAAILAGYFTDITDKIIYLQVSTNDYGLNKWSAATFGTNYARLLDAINAIDPTIIVYAQTAITRGTETANGSGSTMGNYRTQVTNTCNARSSFCTVVDGTAILSYPSDYNDTVHPNLAAQTTYANYVKSLLSIP